MKKVIYIVIVLLILLYFNIPTYADEELIEVPQEVIEISEELGEQYGICPELIQAICWQESRFQATVENSGCIGIMQVNPAWHRDRMERLGVTDLTDIRQNMTVAVDYLAELSEDCEVAEALMRYHGESNVSARVSRGEISNYARNILEISAELEKEEFLQ